MELEIKYSRSIRCHPYVAKPSWLKYGIVRIGEAKLEEDPDPTYAAMSKAATAALAWPVVHQGIYKSLFSLIIIKFTLI